MKQITGSAFSSGTAVEVNLDRENVHDAWFQAVVITENEDQTYFVNRTGPNMDDRGAPKVTVDSLHIRPIPPHYADRNYDMLDKVDVPYDSGWRAGVIVKLLPSRRYDVFLQQENDFKVLGHSEIRPHADWLDGKWVTTSQWEVVVNQEQLGVAQSGNENPEVNLQHENAEEHDMLKSGGGGGQGIKRKRGIPCKIVGKSPEVSVAGMEVHVAADIADEMAVEDNTSNGSELPVQVVVESKGLSSGEAATGLDETRERQVVPLESCTVNAKDNGSLTGNQIQITPFIKKSPVWETIEALEVFQTVPQNPHFYPLSECKEEHREGSAIGIMVTFASLADKIHSLEFEDPRSIFDCTLESLVVLEKHGLDVVRLRDRVNALLSMKDMEGEMLNESNNAETQVREHTVVRRVLYGVVNDFKKKVNDFKKKVNDFEKKIMELPKELAAAKSNVEAKDPEISELVVNDLEKKVNDIVKKVDDFEKMIMELLKEFAAAKSKVEAKDHEISELLTRADAANRRINNARDEFKKLATASWKMP